jgi:predicted phage tail protein
MLKRVQFHGALAQQFGDGMMLDADTPFLLVRGLCCNYPGFEKVFREGRWVMCCNRITPENSIGDDEPHRRIEDAEVVHLMPELVGAGPVFRIIAGVVLIVVGAFTSWTGIGGSLVLMGISLVLGGIAELLAPSPRTGDLNNQSRPEDKPSFAFSSAVNVQEQGGPVPVAYGLFLCGSVVIGSGIETAQLDVNTTLVLPAFASVITAGKTPSRTSNVPFFPEDPS